MIGEGVGFGEFLRRERKAKEIGLRRMATMIGVSPTYLSNVERESSQPPVEDKVLALAKALGQDADELLALAGRVSSELTEIIRRRPREMASLLRTAKSLSVGEMTRLIRQAERARDK